MRLELKDAYLHITRVRIFNISNTIPVVLSASRGDEFFKYLDHISGSFFLEQMNKIHKNWLVNRKSSFSCSRIRLISYVVLFQMIFVTI